MRGKGTKKFGCFAAAVLLAVSALSLPAAAEETDTFEVTINDDGEVVTLKNKAEDEISDVSYTPDEGKTEGTLLITEENGTEHTFEDADLTEDSDFDVLEKLSFLYVVGVDDEKDEEFWHYEKADEIELSDPVTMYVLADMNIREKDDKDADIIGSAEVGTEVEVTGGTPIWFAVTSDDVDGYIAARYLTDDKEEAEEAAEAAAEAEAEAEAEASSSQTEQSETSNTEEVETENGSGNYYEVDGVTYEDVAPDSDAGGYYYQVDGEWYEDVAPDSDAGGYFYYETEDGKRYRILDSDAVSVGYDDPEQDEVFGYDTVDVDGDYVGDDDGDVDDEASDAGGYYFQ